MKIFKKILLGIVILIAVCLLGHFIRERVEMRNIKEDSKLCAVYNLPELKPIKNHLMYMKDDFAIRFGKHFMKINSLDPNGNVLYGLDRLRTIMKDGAEPIYVYSKEEQKDDEEKKNVNVLYFPSLVEDSDKPYVVVIAGGGYSVVSNLLESYPTARKFNELGYPVFVLTYRTDNSEGLFPKPMEDLAQSLKYIFDNHNDFGLEENHEYIVGGFSAGGHITAEWGTDNEGYLKYNLPAPKALFMGYPAISSRYFVSEEQAEAMYKFRQGIVGKEITDEIEDRFSADLHVHSDYPPSYIVYCADDDMVDPKLHAAAMIESLNKQNIKNEVEEGEKGGHGFATGMGTSVEGWIERADTFFNNLDN